VVTSFYHGEKNHYGFFTQVSNLILQSTKKKRIVELLKGNADKKATTAGLLRTVQKIESYFCGNQAIILENMG